MAVPATGKEGIQCVAVQIAGERGAFLKKLRDRSGLGLSCACIMQPLFLDLLF